MGAGNYAKSLAEEITNVKRGIPEKTGASVEKSCGSKR